MRVTDILRSKGDHVHLITEDDSVLDAIHLLVEKEIGSALVKDAKGKIAGIITERDILKLSAKSSKELENIRVGTVMTRNLITGEPEDKITQLLQLMTDHRIRHLPIMNGDKLEGLVSIGDLVKAQLEEVADENKHLKRYIQGAG